MIYILSWTTKKHQKTLFSPLNVKWKKFFKDLHRNLRTSQGKMEFKDFQDYANPEGASNSKPQKYKCMHDIYVVVERGRGEGGV